MGLRSPEMPANQGTLLEGRQALIPPDTQAAGPMFWLTRNRLPGSYSRLSATSRA
jgi:hypothetical protein